VSHDPSPTAAYHTTRGPHFEWIPVDSILPQCIAEFIDSIVARGAQGRVLLPKIFNDVVYMTLHRRLAFACMGLDILGRYGAVF
jgi:hypothetical protein